MVKPRRCCPLERGRGVTPQRVRVKMTTQPVRLQVQATLTTTAGEADNDDGDFDGDAAGDAAADNDAVDVW